MNSEAWEILIARMRDSVDRPTSEQLRLLAAIAEQVSAEIIDVLYIAADGIEEAETEEEEEDGYVDG